MFTHTGPPVGSFSDLMRSASTGVMHFDLHGNGGYVGGVSNREQNAPVWDKEIADDFSPVSSDDTDEGFLGGQDAPVSNVDQNGPVWDKEIAEDFGQVSSDDTDEGYLAGQECEDGNDDFNPVNSVEEMVHNETTNDTCSDSSDNEDGGAGGLGNGKSVHLGDCGCITGEDNGSLSDDLEDISSESSDSEDEQEITIEVDLSQEFYIDKSQEGVPYKKRSVQNVNCFCGFSITISLILTLLFSFWCGEGKEHQKA